MPRLAWVVVLLVAAVALALWALSRGSGAAGGRTDVEARQASAAKDAVATYAAFAERLRTGLPAPGLDVVVEGLRRLAAALDALDVGGAELAVDLRVAAEHVVLNPEAPATTELVRDRLMAVATALDSRHEGAANLRAAADAIDSKAPLAKQIDKLTRFFVQAAASLES